MKVGFHEERKDTSCRLSGIMSYRKEGLMSKPLSENGGFAFQNGKMSEEE